MSPTYEKPVDRVNQRTIMAYVHESIEAAYGYGSMQAREMPPGEVVDFVMKDHGDEKRIAVECKRREVKSTQYRDCINFKSKHEAMFKFVKIHSIDVLIFAAGYDDQIEWYDLTEMKRRNIKLREGQGGRTDRGDPNDQRLCVFYPPAYATIVTQGMASHRDGCDRQAQGSEAGRLPMDPVPIGASEAILKMKDLLNKIPELKGWKT